MKSLVESIFDKDLVEKEVKFGDIYKPVWITSTNRDAPFMRITAMFNMGKLKKAAKGKELDLSEVPQNSYFVAQNSHYDNKYLPTIEMIAGLVADFPYRPEPYYDKDIIDTFKPLARSPLFRRGIDVSLSGEHGAVYFSKDLDIIELHITKSNMTEYTDVIIKFEKR